MVLLPSSGGSRSPLSCSLALFFKPSAIVDVANSTQCTKDARPLQFEGKIIMGSLKMKRHGVYFVLCTLAHVRVSKASY